MKLETMEFKAKLTIEETERLQKLFQRKMALLEIMPTLKSPIDKENLDYLYGRIVDDLQITTNSIQEWWRTVAIKYNWQYGEDDSWSVNFREQLITIHRARPVIM